MSQQDLREDLDLGLNDEGLDYSQDFNQQPPEEDFSFIGASVYLGMRLEEGARIVALNRIQHLLTAHDEKIRQGQIIPGEGAVSKGDDYSNAWNCFQMIKNNQGVASLWQGTTVQVAQLATTALVDQINQRVTIPLMFNGLIAFIPGGANNQNSQLIAYYLCYGAHLLIKSAWSYPFKTVHLNVVCQLPTSAKSGGNNTGVGARHFLKQVTKQEETGHWALYRGFSFDVGSQLFGVVLKILCQMLILENDDQTVAPSLFKVYLVDLACAFIAYPLVIMGNRMRLTVGAGKQHRYKGIADLTSTILKGDQPSKKKATKNYANLWRGFTFSTACSALDIGIAVVANAFIRQ